MIDEILVSLLFIFIYVDQIPDNATTEETITIINSLVFYVMVLKVVYQTFLSDVWSNLGKNCYENKGDIFR